MSLSPDGAPRSSTDILAARWAVEREARLWSGVLLFVFVATHLLNHALGIFGIAAMEAVQHVRIAFWQSIPGTVALYGAFLIHVVLALKRLARRRLSRMPVDEAVQIVLGLIIPYLLISHVVGTRVRSLYGYGEGYGELLPDIWSEAYKQTALVIVAWVHGCIGISQAARGKPFYVRWRDAWIVFGGFVPIAALAGFVSAAREAASLAPAGPRLARADYFALVDISRWALLVVALGMAAALAIIFWRTLNRRRSGRITIRYTGHGSVSVGRGTTVLEASRINGIPHPALCGGRGRCSTCRVAVTSDLASLPPIGLTERAMLHRISAPPNVRLGCQLRPREDITLQILLPFLPAGSGLHAGDETYRWGVEREVTVLFVDIRAFNTLTRRQLPYDLVLLLNRFIREMTQSATAHGGRVDSFMADGLMAIFGLDSATDSGARNAILAARTMMKVVANLNHEFGAALPIPLRIGIGIHTGPAIIAQIGGPGERSTITALGETVSIAARIEAATKDFLVDALVSSQTARAAGLDLPRYENKRLHIRGRDEPVLLHIVDPPPDDIADAPKEAQPAVAAAPSEPPVGA